MFGCTYIMQPGESMPMGVCLDVTFKVDVVALLDVIRVEGAAQPQ